MFDEYVQSHNCNVRIVREGMSEEEAFDAEYQTIERYKEMGQCQANVYPGGRGYQHMTGDKNPMYGRPWFSDDTPQEKIDAWKKGCSSPGDRNPMYGVSPKDRMDEETYNGWLEGHRKIVGENNPNFGNRKLSAFYAENPEAAMAKQSRPGTKNGRCVPVHVFDESMGKIGEFAYIGKCAEFLIANGFSKSTPASLAVAVSRVIKSGEKYCGHYFKLADRK